MSGIRALMSSIPLYAQRMIPPVKYVLPPRKYSGAFSSTRVLAPRSAGAIAAQRAAFPAPTISTSYVVSIHPLLPLTVDFYCSRVAQSLGSASGHSQVKDVANAVAHQVNRK